MLRSDLNGGGFVSSRSVDSLTSLSYYHFAKFKSYKYITPIAKRAFEWPAWNAGQTGPDLPIFSRQNPPEKTETSSETPRKGLQIHQDSTGFIRFRGLGFPNDANLCSTNGFLAFPAFPEPPTASPLTLEQAGGPLSIILSNIAALHYDPISFNTHYGTTHLR